MTTITLTKAHISLLEHICLHPGTETGNGKMQPDDKRLIPGLYAAGLISFGTAAANITKVTATQKGREAVRKFWATEDIFVAETLTFTKG